MNSSTKNLLSTVHNMELQRYKHSFFPGILVLMKQGKLNREDLKWFIRHRYVVSHFFVEILQKIKAKVSEYYTSVSDAYRAVDQNLKEELGEEKKYGGPHEDGRNVFLTALGVDYFSWKEGLGPIDPDNLAGALPDKYKVEKKFIHGALSIIEKGPSQALVLLWYWEQRISLDGKGDYFIFLSAFEKAFPEFKKQSYVEGDALWHIASHAEHDTYHAELAEKGIVGISPDPEVLTKTVLAIKDIFDSYYESLTRMYLKR